MEKNAPEYHGYGWIWWSLGAILATAVITVTLVGLLTGQWPWNRGEVEYNGRPTHPTETIVSTETTVPEDTTVPEETEEQKKPATQETQPATTPSTEPTTEPTTPGTGTGNESVNGGGNQQGSGTATDPSTPSQSTQPEETDPEETDPEQTEPATKPTESEEEDTGGGEKPQPGDIDVPIGPRP